MKRTMHLHSFIGVFSLAFYLSGCFAAYEHEPETPDWRMTLKTIRNGIHKIDTYLNAALDLFGGDDGLCHYRCSDGERNVMVTVLRGERSSRRRMYLEQLISNSGVPPFSRVDFYTPKKLVELAFFSPPPRRAGAELRGGKWWPMEGII